MERMEHLFCLVVDLLLIFKLLITKPRNKSHHQRSISSTPFDVGVFWGDSLRSLGGQFWFGGVGASGALRTTRGDTQQVYNMSLAVTTPAYQRSMYEDCARTFPGHPVPTCYTGVLPASSGPLAGFAPRAYFKLTTYYTFVL